MFFLCFLDVVFAGNFDEIVTNKEKFIKEWNSVHKGVRCTDVYPGSLRTRIVAIKQKMDNVVNSFENVGLQLPSLTQSLKCMQN